MRCKWECDFEFHRNDDYTTLFTDVKYNNLFACPVRSRFAECNIMYSHFLLLRILCYVRTKYNIWYLVVVVGRWGERPNYFTFYNLPVRRAARYTIPTQISRTYHLGFVWCVWHAGIHLVPSRYNHCFACANTTRRTHPATRRHYNNYFL